MIESTSVPVSATAPPVARPKVGSTQPSALSRALADIPQAVLERIARYGILRDLAPYEASKVVLLVANQIETHELVGAARDIETIFFVGPQRLTAGRIAGTQWDEGLRLLRAKVRELRETLETVARGWSIRLVRPPRAAAIPASTAYGISSVDVPPVGLPSVLDARAA